MSGGSLETTCLYKNIHKRQSFLHSILFMTYASAWLSSIHTDAISYFFFKFLLDNLHLEHSFASYKAILWEMHKKRNVAYTHTV